MVCRWRPSCPSVSHYQRLTFYPDHPTSGLKSWSLPSAKAWASHLLALLGQPQGPSGSLWWGREGEETDYGLFLWVLSNLGHDRKLFFGSSNLAWELKRKTKFFSLLFASSPASSNSPQGKVSSLSTGQVSGSTGVGERTQINFLRDYVTSGQRRLSWSKGL